MLEKYKEAEKKKEALSFSYPSLKKSTEKQEIEKNPYQQPIPESGKAGRPLFNTLNTKRKKDVKEKRKVTQLHPLPELAQYGMGVFIKRVEGEERVERERQIASFNSLPEDQKDYIKQGFPDGYPIPSPDFITVNSLKIRRKVFDWHFSHRVKRVNYVFPKFKRGILYLSIRQTLKNHQKSLPSYPFLSLFDRDRKKNGKNFLNRYLPPKEEVEEKLQQFLFLFQQVENKSYEEYRFDLYRVPEKTNNAQSDVFGKPTRKPLLSNDTRREKSPFGVGTKNPHPKPTGKEKREETGKPLLLDILDPKRENLLEKRERGARFFYERYKSKVGNKILNKLSFTYNNQSKDFIETKKHIVKGGYLMGYLFSSSNNNQKDEKDPVLPDNSLLGFTLKNAQTKRYKEDVSPGGGRDSKNAKNQQSNTKDIRKAGSYSFSRTIEKKEKVEKTQHEIYYKKPEIYLRLFPYNTNQFAQTIAYIYQQIGLIPYLSAELKNDKSYTLPDNFGVDSITGKVYIKNNEIYLKYLINCFSETKSSVLKSVIIFCFIEKYENVVKNVSDSLFFYFWFYIIIRFIKVKLKRKLENPAITLYKYKKSELHDELKGLLQNYMNFLVFLTFK